MNNNAQMLHADDFLAKMIVNVSFRYYLQRCFRLKYCLLPSLASMFLYIFDAVTSLLRLPGGLGKWGG